MGRYLQSCHFEAKREIFLGFKTRACLGCGKISPFSRNDNGATMSTVANFARRRELRLHRSASCHVRVTLQVAMRWSRHSSRVVTELFPCNQSARAVFL